MAKTTPNDVLNFWFDETQPEQWWKVDAAFDARIHERFEAVHAQAAAGELHAWRTSAKGRLAEVIVLDQFSRNMYRNTPAAFAQDTVALVLAQEAYASGALAQLSPIERSFLLLPYMHSESKAIHMIAEQLYRDHAPAENLDFELRHKAIIDRFGRYPHRNQILGRKSSDEEIEFLKQPGSSF